MQSSKYLFSFEAISFPNLHKVILKSKLFGVAALSIDPPLPVSHDIFTKSKPNDHSLECSALKTEILRIVLYNIIILNFLNEIILTKSQVWEKSSPSSRHYKSCYLREMSLRVLETLLVDLCLDQNPAGLVFYCQSWQFLLMKMKRSSIHYLTGSIVEGCCPL